MTPCRSRINPTVTGKLSKVGRCGLDRWRHGWRHRAPWVRALCLRSTASQRRTPSRQRLGRTRRGLRRVLPVHTAPPTHRQPRAALALALAVAGQRPALPRCRAQPCRPSPAHENDFTDFSKPSSLRHASTILRSSMRLRATRAKIARPSLRSIQDDAAMAGSWGAATGRTRPHARCYCHCMATAAKSLQIRSIQVVRATSPDQSRREERWE